MRKEVELKINHGSFMEPDFRTHVVSASACEKYIAGEKGVCENKCPDKSCLFNRRCDPCPKCLRHMEYGECRWTDCQS